MKKNKKKDTTNEEIIIKQLKIKRRKKVEQNGY